MRKHDRWCIVQSRYGCPLQEQGHSWCRHTACAPDWRCRRYKLKLNHGDMKATQGDTGHAEIDMLTKVYAHILDADRKITAQRFEEAFYCSLTNQQEHLMKKPSKKY